MSEKISSLEPCDRPLTVALSHAELVAVINYHVVQTKRITRAMGKMLLEKRATNPFASSRVQVALIREAKRLCDAHILRATEL